MICLELTSPFWEDPASLAVSGEDEDAVLAICVAALQEKGYDVSVRDEDGDLIPYDEYEPPETDDA